jgi:hypothetical protein
VILNGVRSDNLARCFPDESGKLSVLAIDTQQHRVAVYIPSNSRLHIIEYRTGSVCCTLYGLIATCATFDWDGHVIVGLYNPVMVLKFNAVSGQAIQQFKPFACKMPTSIIAVARTRQYFVVSRFDNHVVVLNEHGSAEFSFGSYGTEIGTFREPVGIAYHAPSDRVFVADQGNHRVQVFDLDGAVEAVISQPVRFKPSGCAVQMTMSCIAVDHAGNVYCPDSSRHEIVVFRQLANDHFDNARLLPLVLECRDRSLTRPHRIAIDAQGQVYIAFSQQVLVLRPLLSTEWSYEHFHDYPLLLQQCVHVLLLLNRFAFDPHTASHSTPTSKALAAFSLLPPELLQLLFEHIFAAMLRR